MPAGQPSDTPDDSIESGTEANELELASTPNSPLPDNTIRVDSSPQLDGQSTNEQTDPLLLTRTVDKKSQQTGKPLHEADGPLLCLCFDLSRLSPYPRFVLLTVGVSVFFLLNSWVEEYTFKQLPHFQFGWFLTLFELVCFGVFAILERLLLSHEPVLSHTASLERHGIVAVALIAARGLTNVSLQYLNYPTQIIFKSMKLITVMIGSLVILRATFTVYEYASALCLVVAACAFSLGDTDVSVQFPAKGIVIVLLSLVGDSLHSNTQDSLLREHKASTSEAMLFTNLFAAAASFVYILATGELWAAIRYCQAYPVAYGLFVLRSAVIYLGVLCFVLMIKSFGVVAATGVTTVRKIVSILLSFVLFPKPWSEKYVWGGALFAASLCLSVVDQREKRARVIEEKRGRAFSATADRR